MASPAPRLPTLSREEETETGVFLGAVPPGGPRPGDNGALLGGGEREQREPDPTQGSPLARPRPAGARPPRPVPKLPFCRGLG